MHLSNPFSRQPDRPSLRERAAGLRDCLGQPRSRPHPQMTLPGENEAKPDPSAWDADGLAAAIKTEWMAQPPLDDDCYNDPSRDGEHDAALDRRHVLIEAADALPATLENLIPKALALAWIEHVDIWQRGQQRDQYSTDGRLALDIDTIMRTGVVEGDAQPAAPPPTLEIDLTGLIDFTSVTMEDLRCLSDIANEVGSVAYAMAWSGRCKVRGTKDTLNAAGDLMQRLGDALSNVQGAASQEAKARSTGTPYDCETRLQIIALPVVENGDPNETEAFALELLAHAAAQRARR